MNNSKLIHDYLDGKLKQPEQDMLFAELAQNSDLRYEFNQQMKLHMITQSDMAMISPPASATNAIFAELGFSIPPSHGGGHGGAFFAAVKSSVKKYLPNVTTAVLTAVITALVLYWLLDFNYGNSINTGDNNAAQNKPVVTSLEGDFSPILPVYIEKQGLTEADVQRIINNAMLQYAEKMDKYYENYYSQLLAAFNSRNSTTQNDRLADNSTERNDFNFLSYLTDNNSDVIENNNVENNNLLTPNGNNSNLNNAVTLNPKLTPKQILSNFNLSFRGFAAQSNVNVNVPSQSNPWFNNMSVGASYNVTPVHAVGVEVGQEAFPQKFIREHYGEELTYAQNPILFWYGASYRYSLKKVFIPNVLYPYVQVLGGFTKVGPLGRAQLGLSYSPDKRVTFNLGIEGSALWYNVQNKIYNTNKIGLTYGVSVSY
jgi:hypothetical protein